MPASDRNAPVGLDPVVKNTVVTANRELLLVAIRNLHENAVRHMQQQGVIRWAAEEGPDTLTVYVDDEGPGIPEDEIPLVTNRFFRGRNKVLWEADLDYRSLISPCVPAALGWYSKIEVIDVACERKLFGRSSKTKERGER